MTELRLNDVTEIAGFDFRWPDNVERFDRGWEAVAEQDDRLLAVRHALALRIAYGRPRVRSVTWVNGEVAVEGVEADDYAESRSLLGLIRRADKTMARALDDVPADLRHLPIVNQRDEIDAPYSRTGLAVKLAEDDLVGWAAFAISRVGLYGRLRPTIGRARPGQRMARSASGPRMGPPAMTGPLSIERKRSIAAALLRFAESGAPPSEGETELTIDPGADALIRRDPFAFLIGVIFDQGIPFERAWLAPLELTKRLGHLDPVRMVAEPESVRVAVQTPPKLHRFVENMPAWVVLAAKKVVEDYAGDAGRIWGDEPTARELQRRLTGFVGVGQKKAAMAVEILERDLGVPIRELHGSDIAYDIHVRRVFIRTGLADQDSIEHMVEIARQVHPDRPGALDDPAWRIGKIWCHPREPDCPACVLATVCARLIDRTIGLQ
jgi:uncharacterized HhH-GPD family protein